MLQASYESKEYGGNTSCLVIRCYINESRCQRDTRSKTFSTKGVVGLESKSLHLKNDLIISPSVATSGTRLNRKDSCLVLKLSVRVNKDLVT